MKMEHGHPGDRGIFDSRCFKSVGKINKRGNILTEAIRSRSSIARLSEDVQCHRLQLGRRILILLHLSLPSPTKGTINHLARYHLRGSGTIWLRYGLLDSPTENEVNRRLQGPGFKPSDTNNRDQKHL